jgi:hypothetical protein
MVATLLGVLSLLSREGIEAEFRQTGYIEIGVHKPSKITFETLYADFDTLVETLQTHPQCLQKLYIAKERFIRTKAQRDYGTDFFGFFDESTQQGRSQVAFYYAREFHDFLLQFYPELKQEAPLILFLNDCFALVQDPAEGILEAVTAQLGLDALFKANRVDFPLLLKVVKYHPDYKATKPHYDGTAFSLFLDSTDNNSLLLSPFKPSFSVADFEVPLRYFPPEASMLLIPGSLMTDYSLFPTPHLVMGSGLTRYAAIVFCMRPPFPSQKVELPALPTFN